jgi:(Z)-2-((N-methylformamido)methylene)-5-hydroxybutyrolactone dehydrogenase
METRLVEAPPSDGVRDYKMLIGGEWVEALSGKTFESINPYTGRAWATAPQAGEEDVDRAVEAAHATFDEGPWGTVTGTGRARLMRRLAELLAENAQELATVESTDNGKLLREMGGQLGALAEWYYYFAGAADNLRFAKTVRVSIDGNAGLCRGLLDVRYGGRRGVGQKEEATL